MSWKIDTHCHYYYRNYNYQKAKAYKPRKEIFELALKSTGLHADEVIHIGDSLSSDVKGASSVGIKAIWLNRFGKKNSSDVDCITNLLEALDKCRWLILIEDQSW